MEQTNITGRLIDHVSSVGYDELTPGAVQAQKNSIMDMLGVMLAATGLDEASSAFLDFAAEEGSGKCTILGRTQKTSPMLAALANGSLVHALDYEDSHEKAMVHPNSAAFPALMAICQHCGGISGKQFLTAAALASDV